MRVLRFDPCRLVVAESAYELAVVGSSPERDKKI